MPKSIEKYKPLINAFLLLCFITLISHVFKNHLGIINIALIHIIPIVVISIHGDTKSTIFITLLNVIFLNFFYIPPVYSFKVYNELYLWSFVLFGIVGWIVTYQAKNLNTQKRQNTLRESLLHIISHDLRTPLATIHGSINLILSNKNLDDAKVKSLLEDIDYSSLRMKRLLTNLFDTTRLSDKPIDLHLDWCDFEDIIGVALDEFPQTQTDDILEINIGSLELFWGDNTLLVQLIVNLFDNAFKYAIKDTKIVLSIWHDDKNFFITIFNQSENIQQKKIKNIFDKFYRLEEADDISGSGIGLAICKSIVMLHHGTINAKSVDNGIEIQITLPITKKARML